MKFMATANNNGTFGDRLLQAVAEVGGPTAQVPLSKWFKKKHKIKISGVMINRYKKEDAAPRIEKCREFAVALDVQVEWLYTGRGLKRPGNSLSETERRILRMWRRLVPQLKRMAFDYIHMLRLMPDLSLAALPDCTEEEVDELIIDTFQDMEK